MEQKPFVWQEFKKGEPVWFIIGGIEIHGNVKRDEGPRVVVDTGGPPYGFLTVAKTGLHKS